MNRKFLKPDPVNGYKYVFHYRHLLKKMNLKNPFR